MKKKIDWFKIIFAAFFLYLIIMITSIAINSNKARKAAERSEHATNYVLEKLELSNHVIMSLDSFRVENTIITNDNIKNFNTTQQQHDSIINQLKKQRK